MPKKLILLFFALISPLLAQSLGVDCSQKYLVVDKFERTYYQRKIFFPWFASGEGWETRVGIGIRTPDVRGINIGIRVLSSTENGLIPPTPIGVPTDPRLELLTRFFFPIPDETVGWGSGGAIYGSDSKILYIKNKSVLSTGIVEGIFSASKDNDPCVVNYVFDHLLNGELSYLWRDQNGIAKWQASVPGYFVDELSPRWLAPFSMSSLPPVDGRQFEDFEDPSFAIANAGDKEVIVRIRFYNNFFRPWLNSNGKPTVKDSPESINTSWYLEYQEKCLTKYIRLGPMGVKAQIIRDFSKADPQNVGLCGDNPLFRNIPDGFFMGQYGYPQGTSYGYSYGFWGFILFEAVNPDGSIDKTAKIAPLVLQRVGDSLNNIPVKKLLPETTYDEFVTYHR
jgi:hypothetical protein